MIVVGLLVVIAIVSAFASGVFAVSGGKFQAVVYGFFAVAFAVLLLLSCKSEAGYKNCPVCGETYSATDYNYCPADGAELEVE